MAFFPVSVIKGLVAFEICVVLMMGSFDSIRFIGVDGLEVETESLSPSIQPKPSPPKPAPPPMLPKRLPVAVEGVVFCKSCKYPGMDTFLGESSLAGAYVRLQCNNRKSVTTMECKTDKNGYFFIQPRGVTTFGIHKCKIFLSSSPMQTCKKPTDINGGVSGGRLRYEKLLNGPTPLALYSSGPFAFGPTSCPP